MQKLFLNNIQIKYNIIIQQKSYVIEKIILSKHLIHTMDDFER